MPAITATPATTVTAMPVFVAVDSPSGGSAVGVPVAAPDVLPPRVVVATLVEEVTADKQLPSGRQSEPKGQQLPPSDAGQR